MSTPRQSVRIAWALMTILSLGVALYGLSFLFAEGSSPASGGTPSNNDEHFPWLLDQHWVRFAAHFVFGPIALAIGPFQFLTTLRNRRPQLHRGLGYVYAGSIAIAGTAGLALATTAWGGLSTSIGFGMLAVLWLFFTFGAVWHARARRYAEHRRFMVRSFALTFAAVTLRLWIPFFMMQGHSFDETYRTVAWLAWVPNLMFAEWWLRPRKARDAASA